MPVLRKLGLHKWLHWQSQWHTALETELAHRTGGQAGQCHPTMTLFMRG
jgi:hypothetical protein